MAAVEAERPLACVRTDVRVSQRYVMALPYACGLGAAEALDDWRVGWPHDVVDAAGERVVQVACHIGVGEAGFALACDLWPTSATPALSEDQTQAMAQSVMDRVSAWVDEVDKGRAAAGPLAPLLNDYFDRCHLLGSDVVVTYPNGRELLCGFFCGLDVWGRATVRDAEGADHEFAPEQVRLVAAE